jgi:hypothetical protein
MRELSIGEKSKKSLWIISDNFGDEIPPGFLLITSIFSTSGCHKHSYRTPSPTIPVVPVIIIFSFIIFEFTICY